MSRRSSNMCDFLETLSPGDEVDYVQVDSVWWGVDQFAYYDDDEGIASFRRGNAMIYADCEKIGLIQR